eukprot:6113011-Alexandrium_andersonii.AAC.1
MAFARFLAGQSIVGERSAPNASLRDPPIYCTQYGDKYHIDPLCHRIQAARREPFSREYCELCGWQYQ